MARLRYNGLSGALGGSGLTSSATSITFAAALTHSNGTNVPTIVAPDYIPVSILDGTGHLSEVVWLTAYTAGATTGTGTRGKDGTTGVSHSSGDKLVQGPLVADPGGWSPFIDDALGSTAGFKTALSGTWSIVGGVLNQSSTAAAFGAITYDTVLGHPRAAEVEMNYTGGTGADRQMGIYISSSNVSSGNLSVTLQSTDSGATWVARAAAPGVAFYSSIATSYTGSGYVRLGVILVGNVLDIYIGGVYLTSVLTPTTWTPGRYIGLHTYSTSVNFRNLKGWSHSAAPPF